MGFFGDFLQFLGSVIMGKKDASARFSEGLSSAERYLRWGQERGDLRDFMSAIEQLKLVRDEDAPKSNLILRKYNCLCNASMGALQVQINQHKEEAEKIRHGDSELLKEQRTIVEALAAGNKRIESLKEEGSLIKAKEEQRRMEEQEARLEHIKHTLNSGESAAKLGSGYERLRAEAEPIMQNLEAALVSLEMAPDVDPQEITRIRNTILSHLESIRGELDQLNPEESQAEPDASNETNQESSQPAAEAAG